MAIKKFKPTSAGRRQMTVSDFSEITATKPEKSLVVPYKSMPDVMLKVALLSDIKAAVTKDNTELLISNV